MIKKYCDICKREIDKYAETKHHPFFFTRSFEVDLCLDCADKWEEFKTQLKNKYDKLYSQLEKDEKKEINEFFGTDVFGREDNEDD